MRFATIIAACALGACGFDLHLGGTDVDAGSGSDGSVDIDDMEIDAPPGFASCETPNATGLLACYELEDGLTDGVLHDSSSMQRDATTMGLAAAERDKPATSKAATNPGLAQTYAPDAPELDRASGYTVTMWISPGAVPMPGEVLGIFDHERQYAGVIARTQTAGKAQLRCINTGGEYMPTPPISTDGWSFASCSWDGTYICASFWTSTMVHERACGMAPSGIATFGDHGLAIGHLSEGGAPVSPFVGAFDSVQLYDHALSSSELCAMIGQPTNCLLP